MHTKIMTILLIMILIFLQYRLWFDNAGFKNTIKLRHTVTELQAENRTLIQRNRLLAADIEDLKQGFEAIEERARYELGMIKKGEVFYQIIEKQ